jgi:hypothetical protein
MKVAQNSRYSYISSICGLPIFISEALYIIHQVPVNKLWAPISNQYLHLSPIYGVILLLVLLFVLPT